ncbi:hypothetical protein [Pantoea vagans]|uniref:hypothetical protein n=1 Tax=Pantoea vagans TaxID=470934 RepID=UPI003AB0090F
MTYPEVVSSISLLFSFLALTVNAYPHIRDYGDKSDERRKTMLELFTKTKWNNEGDIYSEPKGYYNLSFQQTHGISRVLGELIVDGEKEYHFQGFVTKNGKIKTKIVLPIGKNGMYVAHVEFKYLKEDDQISYTFLGFVGNTEEAQLHSQLDTKQLFWRNHD